MTPEGFTIHPKLVKQLERRRETVGPDGTQGFRGIRWVFERGVEPRARALVQVIDTLGQVMLELLSHLHLDVGAMHHRAVRGARARQQARHGGPIRQGDHLRSPAV
mgnify:CR=1 FL=1